MTPPASEDRILPDDVRVALEEMFPGVSFKGAGLGTFVASPVQDDEMRRRINDAHGALLWLWSKSRGIDVPERPMQLFGYRRPKAA